MNILSIIQSLSIILVCLTWTAVGMYTVLIYHEGVGYMKTLTKMEELKEDLEEDQLEESK